LLLRNYGNIASHDEYFFLNIRAAFPGIPG
jgi:hypothetical protein